MLLICLAVAAFASFFGPPPAHASLNKSGAILLDTIPADRLRAEVRSLLRQQTTTTRKGKGARAAVPSDSRAGGTPQRDQRFYGSDGNRVYLLNLPANENQLQVVGDAVAQAPDGITVVDLRRIQAVHRKFSEYISQTPTAKPARARGRLRQQTSHRRYTSRPTSHSPDSAHSLPAEGIGHQPRARSLSPFLRVEHRGAGGVAGADADDIDAAIAAAATQVTVRNPNLSSLERLPPSLLKRIRDRLPLEDDLAMRSSSFQLGKGHPDRRQARLKVLRDEEKGIEGWIHALRFEGVPITSWEPIERQRIEQVARHYLKENSPEKAYELLRRNGVVMENIERLEDLPAYLLLLEAALQSGRPHQVLYATDALLGRQLYDAAKNTRMYVHDDEIYLLSARAKKAVHSFMRLQEDRYFFGAGTMPVRAIDDGGKELAILNFGDQTGPIRHRATAIKALRRIRQVEERDFLREGERALAGEHLSKAEKNLIRYRMASIYADPRARSVAVENLAVAATYYKQLFKNTNEHDRLYRKALDDVIELNTQDRRYLEDVMYDALYNEKVPFDLRNRLGKLLSEQSTASRVAAGPPSEQPTLYSRIEEVRRLLQGSNMAQATKALGKLARSNRSDKPHPKAIQKAIVRYQAMIKLRKAQSVAKLNPENPYGSVLEYYQKQALAKTHSEGALGALKEVLDQQVNVVGGDLIAKAELMAERSMLYVQLGDYDAAMDDLLQVLQTYTREPYTYRGSWKENLLEEPFQLAYKQLMSRSENGAKLTVTQQDQLFLIQAILSDISEQWERLGKLRIFLEEAVKRKSYTKRQEALALFLQAKSLEKAKDHQYQAHTMYHQALRRQTLLFPHDRAAIHFAIGSFKGDRGIYHLNRALQEGGLTRTQMNNARVRLAEAYEKSGNPAFIPEIIELLPPVLRDQERAMSTRVLRDQERAMSTRVLRDQERVVVYPRETIARINLTLARALEKYALLNKHSRYPHQSYRYYKQAMKATQDLNWGEEMLKERADHQFQAFLRKQPEPRYNWDARDVEGDYGELLQDPHVSLKYLAQVHMSLGRLKYRKSPVGSKEEVFKHYERANQYREQLSESEQALLDLEIANVHHEDLISKKKQKYEKARFEKWAFDVDEEGIAVDAEAHETFIQKLRSEVEPPLRRALESKKLKGKDRFDSYVRLAKVKEDHRQYKEAYSAYTHALKIKGIMSSDLLQVHTGRARAAVNQKKWETALADYDKTLKGFTDIKYDEYWQLYLERAQVRYRLGDYDTVLSELDNEQFPEVANVVILAQKDQLRALTLSRLRRSREALEAFDHYMKKKEPTWPGHTELLTWGRMDQDKFFDTFLVDQWMIADSDDFAKLLAIRKDHEGNLPSTTLDIFFGEALRVKNIQPGLLMNGKRELAKLKEQVAMIATPRFQKTLQVHQRKPFLQSAYATLGEAQLRLELYDDAEVSLRKLLPLVEEGSPLSLEIQSGFNVFQALRLMKEEKYQSAYDTLRHLNPKYLNLILKEKRQLLMRRLEGRGFLQ